MSYFCFSVYEFFDKFLNLPIINILIIEIHILLGFVIVVGLYFKFFLSDIRGFK